VVESELERLRQMKKADLALEESLNIGKPSGNESNLANADRLIKARQKKQMIRKDSLMEY